MSQHDLNIANQGFPAFRADLNDALVALGSTNSGATAPATTFANQLWYDTANNILKIRNEDNDAWISIVTLDQSADTVSAITAATVNAGALNATGNVVLGDASTDTLNVGNGGLVKDSGGKVGIGTSTPQSPLEVNGLIRTSGFVANPSSGGGMEMAWDGTQGIVQAFTNRATLATAPVFFTGGQLKFPATQNASADANTLDDYEEGTFTLSYSGGGSSPTITDQTNRYVKIGRSVTVSISIQINLGSTSTTLGVLSGFPFQFATNYATACGREWYSTGKGIEVIGQLNDTIAPLIFVDNATSLTGITIIGVGVTFSYVTF